MKPVIEIENVSFTYTRAPVLKNVSLAVTEEEFLGVVGPNAGGKSTLIKLILGLLEPDHGTITVLGKSPVDACSHIGYVPQYPTFSRRDFPISVRDTVLMGRLGTGKWYGGYSREDNAIAEKAMQAASRARACGRRSRGAARR